MKKNKSIEVKEVECAQPETNRLNIRKQINGDTRDKKWDFLHGCWKECKASDKSGWDLRYNS